MLQMTSLLTVVLLASLFTSLARQPFLWGKERLVTFTRYSWHVEMQLSCDVVAHTVSHLRVSKKGWCVVVCCTVDLVRMDVFSLSVYAEEHKPAQIW